ncbi:MAG: glycosyltransferase family 39 protein [Candidatus Riflebacteria bacterium]|nr:glycosyltransferase family 39 protein [Candidatus Riflebacteria bacterium]
MQKPLPEDHGRDAQGNWGPALVVAALLGMQLALAWRRHLDHDEVYHLHQAWHVWQGHLPYRDVYGTHHPAFWIFLAPIFWLFEQPQSILLAARTIAWLGCVSVIVATWVLACRLADRRHAWWAAVLVAGNPLWQHSGIEVRADIFQSFFFVTAMLTLAQGYADGSPRAFRSAGVQLAAAFAVLQKAVVCYGAVALALAPSRWRLLWQRPGQVAGEAVRLLLPLGLVIAGFHAVYTLGGSPSAYWDLSFRANQGLWKPYPFPVDISRDFFGVAPALLVMPIVALILVRNPRLRDVAVVPGLFVVTALFALKALHKQYYLSAWPLLAIATAAAYVSLSRKLSGVVLHVWRVVFLAGGLAVPLWYAWQLWPAAPFATHHRSLEMMELAHAVCGPDDPILDPAYEFNIAHADTGYLWMGREEIEALERVLGRPARSDRVREMLEKRPKLVATAQLSERELAFAKTRYVPTHITGLFIAGAVVEGGPGRKAVVELIAPGEYVLEGGAQLSGLELDGRPWPGRGVLGAGAHEVRWLSPPGRRTLRLTMPGD